MTQIFSVTAQAARRVKRLSLKEWMTAAPRNLLFRCSFSIEEWALHDPVQHYALHVILNGQR